MMQPQSYAQAWILTLIVVMSSALVFTDKLAGESFVALVGPISGFAVGQRAGARQSNHNGPPAEG